MATKFNVLECGICEECYDSADHKPLFLPCGHSYCRLCLLHVETRGDKSCPSCRKLITRPVMQLPVNYALIPTGRLPPAPSSKSSASKICQIHNCEVDHFCVGCDDTMCRKCAKLLHDHHRVQVIDDIVSKDELAADILAELQHKINENVNLLTKSKSVSSRIQNLINELHRYNTDVQKWSDKLTAHHIEATQDLETWITAGKMSTEGKLQLFEKLRLHWRGTVQLLPDDQLLSHLRTKLDDLSHNVAKAEEIAEEAASTAHQGTARGTAELLPDSGRWTVAGAAATQSALAGVQAGRRPASLTVVSPPTDPIRQLPQVLDTLGPACTGEVEVLCLDTLWAPTAPPEGRLQAYIEKHGHKISKFYGCPDGVLAVCRARSKGRVHLGVRIADMSDVYRWATLPTKPFVVSCIRGLPAAAGGRMQQLGWEPWLWHFPDLHDGDVAWAYGLVTACGLMTACGLVQSFSWFFGIALFLPRCCLTEEGLGNLLQMFPGYLHTIYCEPVSLSAVAQSRLAALGQQKGHTLHWTIPLDVL